MSTTTLAPLRLGTDGLPSFEAFDDAHVAGRITLRTNLQNNALVIANYTPRTAFDRDWDDVTRLARGFIFNEVTHEVVAFGFEKFFNVGEVLSGDWRSPEGCVRAQPQPGPFEVTVKLDGALGILYRAHGEIRWSTRGSFHSEQAAAAEDIWRSRYSHNDALLLGPLANLTLLAEIIHPVSKIVCNYDYEDLVLLGVRDITTGGDWAYADVAGLAAHLGMRVTEPVQATLEALQERAGELDADFEGFVLRWPDGYRLKVKGSRYKYLHKIITGFGPKRQGEAWRDEILEETLFEIPEEFRQEAEELARILDEQLVALLEQVDAAHQATVPLATPNRGDYARAIFSVLPRDAAGLCFLLLDGKDITEASRRVIFQRNEPLFKSRTFGTLFYMRDNDS